MAVFSVGGSGLSGFFFFFNDRDLSLLNHVKYDSYLITSQRETVHEHTHNITITVSQTCQ